MTLEQIKADSLAKGAKFFTPEIKNAFKSRYSKRTVEGINGIFFVTSEEIQTVAGVPERRFAVRGYNPVSGEVGLISALGQYATDYAAHCAAKGLAGPTLAEDAHPEHVNEPAPVTTTVVPGSASDYAPFREGVDDAIPGESCATVGEDGVCGVHDHGATVIPFPLPGLAAVG
jgi:hypothetical protein